MKGVILAGGKGTRLYPLTKITNKHLLPVGREPMINNPVRQMVSAGIREVLIITGGEHKGEVMRLLEDGREFGCRFTYRVQEEAGGIAHALLLAEDFAGGSPLCVILGDNITTHSIRTYAERYKAQGGGARVLLKEVADPERYGIATLKNRKIVAIEEKPRAALSTYAVVGIYFYDRKVFEIIRSLQPSPGAEWGITPVNNEYLRRGELHYDLLQGHWVDAGTLESYQQANILLSRFNNRIVRGEQDGGSI